MFIPKNKSNTIYTTKGFDHLEIMQTSKSNYHVSFYAGNELVDKRALK